jgi:hypothetical protein
MTAFFFSHSYDFPSDIELLLLFVWLALFLYGSFATAAIFCWISPFGSDEKQVLQLIFYLFLAILV